jgi:predicted nucleic acid-binding protein
MELVIDTNIVLSAIVKNSVSRLLLLNPNLILYSPEGLISELEEHKDEIKEKSGLSEKRYNELMPIFVRFKPKPYR